jgi:hypothetical protein
MRAWLARLRPLHLTALTFAYWAGLAVLRLTEPVLTAWRLARLPPGQSSIEAGITNTVLHLTMVQGGATAWAGAIGLGALLTWLLGPPAFLVAAWWFQRSDGTQTPVSELPHADQANALPASRFASADAARRVDEASAVPRRPHAS